MADLREVELRIALVEGMLSRPEVDASLAILIERDRVSDDRDPRFLGKTLNEPVSHD